MSYILDALKRSEAERERERGSAPSLHAQAQRVIDPAEDEVPVVPPLKAGRLIGLGLLLAGVLAGVGWWLWSPAPPAVATAAATAAAVTRPVSPPPATVPAAAAMPPLPSQAPADPAPAPAATLAQSVPPALPPGVPPSPDQPGAPLAVPPSGASLPPAAPLPVLRDAPPPNPGTAAPPPPTVRLQPAPVGPLPGAAEPAPKAAIPPPPAPAPTPAPKTGPRPLSQLPAELRRQLPPLKVSGSVYSPDVPARMLILDGQILREGQNAGPELLIEQIGPKAAVLSFRGQRFELPYGP